MLRFTDVRSHEQLLADGLLSVFVVSMGHAIFISHQWLSEKHPDPLCLQFKVLQDSLRPGRCLLIFKTQIHTFAHFGQAYFACFVGFGHKENLFEAIQTQ